MKISPVFRYDDISPAMMFRKKVCPQCNVKMKKIIVFEIVKSGSLQADKYPIHPFMLLMFRTIKVVLTEFHCPTCQKIYTYKDLDIIRKEKRRKEKEQKRLEKQQQKSEEQNK